MDRFELWDVMCVRTWCPTSQMILSFGKGLHSLCYDAKGRLAQVAMMTLYTFIPYVWLVKHIVERNSELYNTEAEQKKFPSHTTKLGQRLWKQFCRMTNLDPR